MALARTTVLLPTAFSILELHAIRISFRVAQVQSLSRDQNWDRCPMAALVFIAVKYDNILSVMLDRQ